jgi:hypothetical protein
MTTLTRTLRLLSISAVAAIVALGVMVASPASSTAAPAADSQRQVRNYYGAIAISVDQAWGLSYDYRTKRAAKSHAKQKCKANSNYPGRCTVTVWVRNGCAATAVKVNQDGFVTRYASAFARSKATAKRKALNKLSRPKKVIAWTCTTR